MNYDQAREQFQNGDIVFFSKGKKNLVRRLIAWFSKGPFYHVGIAFWIEVSGVRRLMLAESQPDGFRIMNLGFYRDRNMTVFRCPVEWDAIVEPVVDSAGLPYSFADMALIGAHERFGTPIIETWEEGGVCSVMVAKILRKAGVALETMVSPQRLYDQLVETQLPALYVRE